MRIFQNSNNEQGEEMVRRIKSGISEPSSDINKLYAMQEQGILG